MSAAVQIRGGDVSFQSIGGAIFETDLASGIVKDPVVEPEREPVRRAQQSPQPQVAKRTAAEPPVLTSPGAIVKAARARIREINRELKRLAALKTEKDELERLVAAAKLKPGPKVRALRTG